MPANKEVEIKFLVEDLRSLRRKLRDNGFREVTARTHEINTLYDTAGRSLRTRDELLRIRKYGNRWIFTHKGKGTSVRHKSRTETETEVANGGKLAGIVQALGFKPWFRYEKFRSEWTDGKGHVVLDETPIGIVSEIEGPPRWIDATAKRLGVARQQYVTLNYVQMFFDWKRQTGSKAQEMTFRAVGTRRRLLRQQLTDVACD
jgi:adenylate cyclase class 2